MNEKTGSTYTFVSDNKTFKVTVKSEFLKIIPNPESLPFDKMMTDNEMQKYIHNENGPAITVLRTGYEEYWLDGKRVSPEVAERMKHRIKAANELEEILDEPDAN